MYKLDKTANWYNCQMFLTSFPGKPLFPSMPGLPCREEKIKKEIDHYAGKTCGSH